MKRCGARWKSETGQHILHLRALALSDRWEPAVELTLRPLALATAWTELGRSCHVLAAAREERDLAMDELHRYASGLRGLLRAVCALPAASITDVPETDDAAR
jgi:hypothetical protein